MINLSDIAKIEKNKLFNNNVFITLLEVDLSQWDLGVVRVCDNTEDIVWNGYTWNAFPFELDIKQDTTKGDIPNLTIKVSNVNRLFQQYVEKSNGAVGAKVTLRLVLSNNLDSTTPEIEEQFEVIGTQCDAYWITFTLGAMNPLILRFPKHKYIKNFCRWKFKSPECGYTGVDTYCNHTFEDCKKKRNQKRFGGFIGIQGGVWT
jgi:lambda family phage minor tail protein L